MTTSAIMMLFMSLLTSENEELNHSSNTFAMKNISTPKHFGNLLVPCHLNIFYKMNDPEDKLYIFNKLVSNCLNEHAPLKKNQDNKTPAPWLKV